MSDPREKILTSACELYLQDGLDGFSMRKLARTVGVTAPALYRHYDSREAVLIDVVREAHRAFSAYLYRGLEGRTPEERLDRACEGYVDFALRHPRWYQVIFTASQHLGVDELPEDVRNQGCAVHQFWGDRLRECMDAGLLKRGDPKEVGLTMWAHIHGLITLYHNGHLQVDEDGFKALRGASWSRLLAGMATDEYVDARRRQSMAELSVVSS